jgi:diketogulonate reductase-like aldo/keto reductase
MLSRSFGRTGTELPIVGQGTWNLERNERKEAIRSLQRGIELGMTHLDTAEMYGRGAVEEIVAEAIAGLRDRVTLVSKVLPSNASRQGTVAACHASLRRLKTDHLDGYLLHWAGDHPLQGTVEAFEQLRQEGKIRWWGVSNFDEDEIEQVVSLAGPGRVACNQVLYHLQERRIEHALLPACRSHQIAVVGYSPFGSGSFPRPDSPGGQVLARIASERGATARQVALAFLCRDPDLFAIPKAGRVQHVEDNAPAGDLVLEPGDIEAIDRAFPRGPRTRGIPTL